MAAGAQPGGLSALATPGRGSEGALLDMESLTPRTRAQATMRRSHSATEVSCWRPSLPAAATRRPADRTHLLVQPCKSLLMDAVCNAPAGNAAVQAAQSIFASYISRRFMSGW